jgi:hypothetical protein
MRKAYRHARLAPNPLYARVVPLLPRFTATLQQIEDEQKVAANVLEAARLHPIRTGACTAAAPTATTGLGVTDCG